MDEVRSNIITVLSLNAGFMINVVSFLVLLCVVSQMLSHAQGLFVPRFFCVSSREVFLALAV